MSEFVHLHLHTEFSLLDGACRVGEVLDQVVRLGMPSVAVTEHGNMFSAVAFHDEARKRGINPILGCEVYVAPESRLTKSGRPGETANHLVLLAENHQGYKNLIKLVSVGYTDGFYYKPRIDKDLLAQHANGLIGLSSCLKGEVATGIRSGQPKRAIEAAATFRDVLGAGNFFLEMQYQGIEEQRTVNEGLQPIASDLGLPLVCTNDVHYLTREDCRPHDVLLCIGTGKSVNDAQRLRYHGDQFYLKTAEEMATVFSEFPASLANTLHIAERCDVDLGDTQNHLPSFDVPEPYSLEGYFEHVVREGFETRLARLRGLEEAGRLRHTLDEYETRLAYELRTIKDMKYAGYFLIVWDFIRYARDRGIPVGPGRGSAAGSVVAYCLGITDIDPLEFDLIFERFLNPERVSLPDIDIDFCERRRGEVIEYVTRKYGRENVAQIITFGTMKARAAVRDVGRVLDMSYADVDKVAKQIPATLDITIDQAIEEVPALKDLERSDREVKELLAVARRLEGMTRHASVHAAGVVIAPRPLTEFVPLYKGQRNELTTQWPMKEIERIGLLKMDFLGLSTLTLLSDAVEQIRLTTDESVDLALLPLDDPATFELFSNGWTLGIFQFESSGMRDVLRKAKPERFDDLIALNALYRPGPLRGGVIDDFIARKHGKVPIKYDLPELEPILCGTYGVIAYQEQVMRIASDLAGFSMGEADLLRKAMGKKSAAVMQAQRERFVSGAVERGFPKAKAVKIFDLMEYFAGYGFNKSHSSAYALLAYQTAYLKANYPPHFMAALLTIESQNTEKLALYLGECRDLGISILPPDLNTSDLHFAVTESGVRFGLAAIKNVGETAMKAVLDVRERQGRIASLVALCEDVDLRVVNKRVLESLVKAGAFDSVGAPDVVQTPPTAWRPRLHAAIDRAIDHGRRRQEDRERGQNHLFDDEAGNESYDPLGALPEATAWSDAERLTCEKEALGLYLSGHPIGDYDEELRALGARTVGQLTDSAAEVQVGGIVEGVRLLRTRRGDRMATCALGDQDGTVEVIVFPEAFKTCAPLVVNDTMVLVRGKLEADDESVRVFAKEMVPISKVREDATAEVAIRLAVPPHGRETFVQLAGVFARHRGDRPVRFELELNGSETPLRVCANVGPVRVRPSADLVAEVEALCGQGTVRLNRHRSE